MEELLRIRRELSQVRAGRAAALRRFFLGAAGDLVAAYEGAPAAWHRESAEAIDEALRKASHPAERDGLARLRSMVQLERLRAATVRLEASIRAEEVEAAVRTSEEELPLRVAERRLLLEPSRGRRERLSSACGEAVAAIEGKRSDLLALQREATARLGGSDPLDLLASLAGLDAVALAAEAEATLRATEDASAELLPRALDRWVEPGLRPLPRGDLAAHDLAFLKGATFLTPLVPAGGLLLAVRRLVERMAFDRSAERVRIDREPRERAQAGAFVAAGEGSEVAIAAPPIGTAFDWIALFGALGEGLVLASVPPAAAPEDRFGGDRSFAALVRFLFTSILREPIFHERELGASRGAAREGARSFALLELLRLRRACALALHEIACWRQGPTRQLASAYAEILERATGARHDPRRFLDEIDPELPALSALRGLSLLGAAWPAIRERCDEDWWRNPRTGPLLQAIASHGGALRGEEVLHRLGAAEPSLVAYAASLVAFF